MKHLRYKSVFIGILAAMLLTTGCVFLPKPVENNNNDAILAELNAMKQQLLEIEANAKATPTAEPAPAASATPEVIENVITVEQIVAQSCTVNGAESVRVDGETAVHAVANEIEGFVFDHWEYDGKTDYESGAEADFVFSHSTVVCAVYRKRLTVNFQNCHMTLLDKKGNSVGASYTEFDFEEDYLNPETKETCKGGEIDFYVFADIPAGKEVDYWLINGVKYESPNTAVRKFRVEQQMEATTYEVVFR